MNFDSTVKRAGGIGRSGWNKVWRAFHHRLTAAGMVFISSLMVFAPGAATAQNFGMSVSNTPTTLSIGNTLTYTIFVTNFASTGENIYVTNQLSAPVNLISSSNNFYAIGVPSNSSGTTFIFQLGTTFQSGTQAALTLKVSPTVNGILTNIVSVAGLNFTNGIIFVTNLTTVSNQSTAISDSLSFPTFPVLANDWVTYTVTATNPGTSSATGLTLSNAIPPGVNVVSYRPANGTNTNGAVVFSIGTLAAHTGTNVTLTVQPTTAGSFTFTSVLSRQGSSATATNLLVVSPFDTTQMTAANVSGMTNNPQTGLMQQTVRIANTGTNSIPESRLVVTGLSNIQANVVLYNAIGTNNGNPFVQFNGSLNTNQTADLVLEYFITNRMAISIPNGNYQAVPVTNAVSFVSPGGTPFAITRMTNLPSGSVLIEFQSVLNRSYTILYADNSAMSNALAAVPAVIAPADRTQWIDDGPPKTISAPTNSPQRFYKVIQNQ